MIESQLKIIKYILDLMTSYNNSSVAKYWGKINPKLAGLYTFISSVIGLYIMWRWIVDFLLLFYIICAI